MAYIINTDNRQLIDAGENQLSYIERPNIIYGDGGVLSFDLLSGRMPLECSTSDTWELYADTDYIHTTGAGLLANGYSGAVTSIEATDLTNTPELTGFLLLQNSAGERDRIPYSEYNAGTGIFTVDDTLENIYLAGDSVLIEDQLVLYSGNANFNNSADREDVNVLTGKICVRYDALTRGFLNKITAPNTRVHIEIWRYIPGQLRPQKVLQDDIYCSPTVGTLEGAPSTNDPVYYTAAQTLALLNAGYEIELSDDGITWYELTFDELEQPIMPLTARWWHYRNALTAGTWSETIPILVGPKGDDGSQGASFTINAIGLLSGLSAYDDEPEGFVFYATDTGNIYFKLSATTADWSNPVPFKGEKGDDGVSTYTYIAYASDDEGTGFNLTPSAILPYRAEIVSATIIATPTLTDFAAATWVKYIGEDGASTANAVSVVSSGFTGNLSTDIETVQDALDEIDALELGSGGSNSLTLGITDTTAYRGDRGKIAYDHSQVAHAPSDAQKNSDITKAEIEAKLTGEISSHTHADSGLTDAPSDNEIYGRKNAEWTKVVIPDATLNLPMLFALPSKLEGDPALHFAIEFHETDDYSGTAVYSIDTGTSQTGVKVLDGTAWVAFPAGGAGTLYYGNPIEVEYNVLMGGTPKNVRYKLYLAGDDPAAEPWKYTTYPAVGGAGGVSDGVDGVDGVDGANGSLLSAEAITTPKTITTADAGKMIITQFATADVVHIQADAILTLPIGYSFTIQDQCGGNTTLTGDAGVTFTGDSVTFNDNDWKLVWKISADTWQIDLLNPPITATSSSTAVNSSGFTGNLSTDIETVQDALDEIDALELGSGGGLTAAEVKAIATKQALIFG